jgi:hypothetical protein
MTKSCTSPLPRYHIATTPQSDAACSTHTLITCACRDDGGGGTVQALVEHGERPLEELYPILAKHYIASFDDMGGRAPGPMTGQSVRHLKSEPWDSMCPAHAHVAVCGVCSHARCGSCAAIPYCRLGGGCGGAMRAMCIGLRFPGEANVRPWFLARMHARTHACTRRVASVSDDDTSS